MNKPMMKHVMEPLNNSRGATAVMVAMMLTVLLAMAAAAIDIGHALVARNELQNVSDAAALAGTRALGIIYEGMTNAEQQSYVLTGGDQAIVEAAVQATANANSAAGVAITINASDIAIGIWNPATRTHTPTVNQPKAVRVLSRRDASANGAISTFFGSVIGMTNVSVGAVATADMTAVGQTAPGQLDVPFAISEYYFTQFGCGDAIQFYPNDGTPQACAAWQTFDQSPSNANTLRNIIDGMIAGTYQSPATAPGDSLNFINGNVASAFPNLINLYNAQERCQRLLGCLRACVSISGLHSAQRGDSDHRVCRSPDHECPRRAEFSDLGDHPVQHIRGEYHRRRTTVWAGPFNDSRSCRIIRTTEGISSHGSIDCGVD